jgi:uroporphyrinogen decarboxylase
MMNPPRGFEPDVEALIANITRRRRPRRVHFIELFLDDEIKERIGGICNLGEDQDRTWGRLDREIALHAALGYDVFRVNILSADLFALPALRAADTTSIGGQHRGVRDWTEEHRGPIQSWDDFARYPWPKVSDVDFGPLDWLEKNLPDNMGVYDLTAHVLELVTFLLGYETFCYFTVDEPELIDALCERVGEFFVEYTETLCDYSCVPLAWGSDDMGYRTGTLASPRFLREKILPWHGACADAAHRRGKPYLLHNCGNIEGIMDDLIDGVRIDGKHSFEDAIMPVTDAWGRYGRRIALLGGIDVDFLIRADEERIRKRVRETLDACTDAPGYCLGTGNTVANYIPVDNFLVMLDEGRRYPLR